MTLAEIKILMDVTQDDDINVQVWSQTDDQARRCDADVVESYHFTSLPKAVACANRLTRKYHVEWESN